MNISIIFTVAALAFLLIYAAIGLLKSLKKNWIMSLVRLGVTILAAIVAIPLCTFLLEFLSETAYGSVVPLLPEAIVGLLGDVAVGTEGLRVLAILVAAPVLYPVLYLILHRVLMIVVWVVEKIVGGLLGKKRRSISMTLGAVTGLISAVVLLIPICGFVMLGVHVIEAVAVPEEGSSALIEADTLESLGMTAEDLETQANDMESNPVLTVIYSTVGKPVFNALTTAELNTEDTHGEDITMNLETELCGLLTAAGYAMDTVDAMGKEDFAPADKEILFDTADSLMESEWIRLLAVDTLVAMSEHWLAGEEFAGMARPALDPSLDPVITSVLKVLAIETVDTIEEDLHTLLDVVGDLLVHDLLAGEEETDYTALVARLGSSGLLNEMMAKLQANPRLNLLASELKALSLRLVTNMLGVDQLKDGQYAEMMGDVAGTLTDSLDMSKEERDALITSSLQDSFASEGYDVPADVVTEMSDQIIADLGADGEITENELTDYLVNHGDSLIGVIPDESLIG